MRNITKKFIAGSMLAMFTLTNSLTAVVAMEDIAARPKLRDGEEYSLRLKGDVSYIKANYPVSISLRDSDVKQVLRMFADKAGMNIIFHNSVSGQVTLDLVDVPLNEAFDMVMGINNLTYVVEDNTIFVANANSKDFSFAKQDMTLIPVSYVNAAALAEFLNKSVFNIKKPGFSGTGDTISVNPATNELIVFGTKNDVNMARKVVERFDKKPASNTFKVNHTTPKEMANMICKMLVPATGSTGGAAGIMTGAASSSSSSSSSSSGSSSSSSSSSGSSSGGGSGNMTLNEGTVACTVESKVNGGLGLKNMQISYYPQLGTVGVLGGSESQIEMIKSFIEESDKKAPQAYLEVSIVELNEEGSKTLSNTWNFYSNNFTASFNGSSTTTTDGHPIFIAGDKTPDGKLTKYTGPFTVTYAIDYLIKSGKGRVVVNPRIIMTNGVESKIEVTQDYLESVSVNASTSTGGTVVTRNYNVASDQGVTLSIMPFVSPDGYVTLNLKPEYSTPIGEVEGQETAGDNTVTYKAATLLSHRNLDLKSIRIRDGETLVIAGMIQELESKTVNKIPVLGDLPGIGGIFRTTTSSKHKSEMIIMLTPKIITDNDDAVSNTEVL